MASSFSSFYEGPSRRRPSAASPALDVSQNGGDERTPPRESCAADAFCASRENRTLFCAGFNGDGALGAGDDAREPQFIGFSHDIAGAVQQVQRPGANAERSCAPWDIAASRHAPPCFRAAQVFAQNRVLGGTCSNWPHMDMCSLQGGKVPNVAGLSYGGQFDSGPLANPHTDAGRTYSRFFG